MKIFIAVLVFALACNEFCSNSCELFNAHESCYTLCDCPVLSPVTPVPTSILQAFEAFKQDFFSKSSCNNQKLESCSSLKTYTESFTCFSENKCKELAEFKYLTENLPKSLWIASSPKFLFSYVQDWTELNFYKTFDKCQRTCLENLNFSENSASNYFFFEQCVGNCGEILDKDIDENCLNSCVYICPNQDKFCLRNCLKKKCGIIEGNRRMNRCSGCSMVAGEEKKGEEVRCDAGSNGKEENGVRVEL